MTNLLETISELFDGATDLYQVLGIDDEAKEQIKKDDSTAENKIKRGYHKQSLKFHPDRAKPEEREEATKKFQALGAVYSILSNKDKRALYDESGEIDDEGDAVLKDDRDWQEYWRLLFKKISVEDIHKFEEEYRNSEEELNDLTNAYLESEGDMDYILDNVLCCTFEDEPRFRELLTNLIKEKKVPDFKKFSKESGAKKSARKRRAETEAKEAEEHAKEIGISKENLGDENALRNMIMKRQEARQKESESFLDQLAAKYGGGGSSGSKKKAGSKKK